MPQKKSDFNYLFLVSIFLFIFLPQLSLALGSKQKIIQDSTKYVDKYFSSNLKTGDQDFIYLGEQKIATVDAQGNVFYNLDDHLASPTLITDSVGQIVSSLDYQPFGKLNSAVSSTNDHYQFSDKEFDAENNWQYFGARYYDNILGRFSSLDPVYLQNVGQYLADPQQLNSYAYARNNPIKLIDKSGEKVSEYQPYKAKNNFYNVGEAFGVYRGLTLKSGGEFTGSDKHEYQCVALAKDFVKQQFDVTIGRIGSGSNFGKQEILNSFKNAGNFEVYKNGATVMPQENDIISWQGGGYGHVGVIAEISFDPKSGSGYVYTLEQNASKNSALFAQTLQRNYNKAGQATYTIGDRWQSYQVQAWARYGNQSQLPAENYSPILYTPAPNLSKYYE